MSYDIYFIKKKDLNSKNIHSILESEVKESDDYFISRDLMVQIKESLISKGLNFETFESKDKDYLELNFSTYQISMFNSQIAISLPYWDENSTEGINKEIKIITNTFLEFDLRGFDPQTEKFITQKQEIKNSFTETKSAVDEHVKRENVKNNENLIYFGIGIGILIILLIRKKIKTP